MARHSGPGGSGESSARLSPLQAFRAEHSRGFYVISCAWVGILAVIGLYLVGFGGYLVHLGGSPYYVLFGLAMLAAAVFYFGRPTLSLLCVVGAALLTLPWAFWECGANYWALFPRLLMPFGLAVVALFLYSPAAAPRMPASWRKAATCGGWVGLVLCVLGFGRGFMNVPIITPDAKQLADYKLPTPEALKAAGENVSDWTAWGRTNHGTRYAPFQQINRDNVKDLKLAWQAHTGDLGPGVRQDTPLQIGDTVFDCTPNDIIVAMDADTGKIRWRYNTVSTTAAPWQRCRGLAYYEVPAAVQEAAQQAGDSRAPRTNDADEALAPPSACRRRLINTTIDARLIELDADTGKPCATFGQQGVVDLTQGMGRVPSGFYFQTAAPTVARGQVIIGGWVMDNMMRGEPSGVIRAFDAVTGKLTWAWDMGHPDWTGAPPPGEHYTRGTPNMWTSAAYDDKLGLVYVPLGNDTPDYNTINRKRVSHLFNSSIVALDIKTGKPRWKFQTVHKDVWDYDLPSQPALVDVPDGKGGTIPAVIQTTKRGQIFFLNRATGEPITKVEEKPVATAKGELPGEELSPTQPYSVGMPTIGADHLTEKFMWGATMLDQLLCRIQFHKVYYTGDFTPASLRPSIEQPGNIGGLNWGSVSYDPVNHLAMMNDIRVPSLFFQVPRDKFTGVLLHGHFPNPFTDAGHGPAPQYGTPYGMITEFWLSVIGAPCVQPPYGTITAVNMDTHKIAWQVQGGTVEKMGPFGIPSHLPMTMGMPTYAGTMTTAGGLVFFSGNQDFYLRAYDGANGKLLWQYALPIGSSATPMSYVSPKTGRQYILVSVGGMNHNGPTGDLMMAFALPEKNSKAASTAAPASAPGEKTSSETTSQPS
ncbi:membrane-bound PQQ-dependent dehydrogenase, glucose/quinate/shikimate family [Oecophyllibacter saccharovorans]|uniref:membrane-bound PQQ-dependent dehydrogenase, glucose/quinate/shikimate family n=1 Tax=Oecophyllibacter saccharovorans TaxID=2558360 RepID=UPI001141765E|nr:membrane-bound PQQ-dependent dehydrogenase, glucose/quinate/shikimate family [Oecophyllibacter saccharovorans]QDH15030.1 membrane-bound PQQ-dependent dehydrogenase, glucose/quinate/shikimate family [Oecophyllibacter saccharovorans]